MDVSSRCSRDYHSELNILQGNYCIRISIDYLLLSLLTYYGSHVQHWSRIICH